MSDFCLIPAIDLLDGQVVRLLHGDYEQRTNYTTDPGAQAAQFVQAGAGIVHVVDLNAARSGKRDVNASAIREIVAATGEHAKVELGGGIRDHRSLEQVLALGVRRCVIGTAAVEQPQFLREALAGHGADAIIVGVDAKDGRVRTAGWEVDGGISTLDLLPRLEDDGVRQVIFTDIAVDGALTGPAYESIRAVLEKTSKLEIIASGGVSATSDVPALALWARGFEAGRRLFGVIAGRAIYEGHLDVAQANRALRAL